jgi:hypothetical protein
VNIVPAAIEKLEPVPFVLLGGAVYAVLEAISSSAVAQRSVASQLVLMILLDLAMVFFLWAGVRRRRFSVWWSAWQLTLAWDLGNAWSSLIVLQMFDVRLKMSWLDFVENLLSVILALSVFRFVEAAAAVAIGRLLPGSGTAAAPRLGNAAAQPDH